MTIRIHAAALSIEIGHIAQHNLRHTETHLAKPWRTYR